MHPLRSAALVLACIVFACMASSAQAQLIGRGLALPVPSADGIVVAADSFSSTSGERRQFDVYRARGARGPVPVVVFANGGGPELRRWRSYVEWAQLVTARGFAGVLYGGPVLNPQRPIAEHVQRSVADLDSLLLTVTTVLSIIELSRG
jgi:hypothetical protein